jgi:hypothetical protein
MSVARLADFELVYLGSPYSKYQPGIEAAFRDASAIAGRLLLAGVKVYSPIAHTHPIAMHGRIDPYDHKIWLPFDQAMMDASKAMVVAKMDSWDKSFGIAHEIEYFGSAGKPIFYLDPETMELADKP